MVCPASRVKLTGFTACWICLRKKPERVTKSLCRLVTSNSALIVATPY
ncbi:Uncharacterised protein [Vibrio cholerae]|nr:Uncharacterised protein [Vibrio cholerae]CSI14467.1 Uncharacterised protein [Vibrio cholerae]